MTDTIDIYKAAGVIIRNRKLLVERSKGKAFFIAPGGSIEAGETAQQALRRELMEEFQIRTIEEDFRSFGTFSAPAAGQEERMVHMEVFTVTKWHGEPRPDNEVEELAWIISNDVAQMPIGSIFAHEVIPRLKAANLID